MDPVDLAFLAVGVLLLRIVNLERRERERERGRMASPTSESIADKKFLLWGRWNSCCSQQNPEGRMQRTREGEKQTMLERFAAAKARGWDVKHDHTLQWFFLGPCSNQQRRDDR